MKIGVAGLWHLGVMYAVGFAELGHLVIAYDPNADSISGLKIGDLLVFEPKLSEMLLENLKSGNLKFTSNESDLELDPSRILLELNSDLIERARYLTVGKGV